jgi:sigma-54 specific flagellar transcriptional regulator A
MPIAVVIDHNPSRAEETCAALELLGHTPCVQTTADAESLAGAEVVILAPPEKGDGLLDTFRYIREQDPHLPIVAMNDGARASPWDEEIDRGCIARIRVPLQLAAVREALQQVKVYRKNRHLEGDSRSPELFRNLVGSSVEVRRVRTFIEQVAQTEATVLLTGESGTGKEVVARNIHYHSPRRYKPFVPVNCGAIPGDLLESELFGHEKGAFTGAVSSRRGRFEMAAGGTLFLDEIGDTPLHMQVKLLRVLQERTFERVGSNESLTADVRVVAATHSDLEKSIREGRFREDLYYRLNVFPIHVPPLRSRSEDLPLLVNDLLQRSAGGDREPMSLSVDAQAALQRYPWPGNVRELANLIERLAILFPGRAVEVDDLPEKYRPGAFSAGARGGETEATRNTLTTLPRDGLDLKAHLNALERSFIEQALEDAGGVVAHAAKRLRMGRTTLVEKMRKHRIKRKA